MLERNKPLCLPPPLADMAMGGKKKTKRKDRKKLPSLSQAYELAGHTVTLTGQVRPQAFGYRLEEAEMLYIIKLGECP